MGLETITFSGGEPLLHPMFLPALQKSVEYGFRISVFSNLTLLNNEIIQVLKTNHIKEIQASLYSVEPHIHDSITKLPGSCEKDKGRPYTPGARRRSRVHWLPGDETEQGKLRRRYPMGKKYRRSFRA
jgi:MoaA/NifB/PqqE/SkfB family radical SAM enzyme